MDLTRDGYVWIATADGGVSRFNGVHFDNLTEQHGLPCLTVMALEEDEEGRVLFGTYGAGLLAWDGAQMHTVVHTGQLPSEEVLGLRWEDDRALVVMTTAGVAWVREGRLESAIVKAGGTPVGRVYDAIRDREGRTWLASLERGVVDAQGMPMAVSGHDAGEGIRKPWGFAPDPSGCLWIGTQYTGAAARVYRTTRGRGAPTRSPCRRAPGPSSRACARSASTAKGACGWPTGA